MSSVMLRASTAKFREHNERLEQRLGINRRSQLLHAARSRVLESALALARSTGETRYAARAQLEVDARALARLEASQ